MKNIKIGKLLSLGFSIPALAILALVVLSMSQMKTINHQSTIISENWLPSVRLVEQINTKTADLRNAEAVHIISTNPEQLAKSNHDIESLKTNIKKTIDEYATLVSSNEESALLSTFNEEYARYLVIQNKLLNLSNKNINDDAKSLFLNASAVAYNAYSLTLTKISDLNAKGAASASVLGDEIYNQALNILFITVVLLVAGIIIIAIVISKYLIKSVTMVQNAMIEMSGGKMTTRIDGEGSNELALLAKCFNKTAEKMSSLTQQLITVADNVNSSSNNLASTMHQSDINSQHMLMQVEQAATAVNEMSSTAVEISRNANEAEMSTRVASENVNSGRHYLALSDDIAEKISLSITESADIVNELNQYSNQIGSVIDVINGISEQTNLLALNAAIEAARAGETGRGFAVVADEVRSLAAKTQQSTIEIQEIITLLQTQAKKADVHMQSNSGLIIESKDIAAQVRESFEGITNSVQQISDMNSQVATASTEQSSVTDEISQNITSIVDMVNQNVIGISESSKESNELSAESTHQKEILSFYQI